MRSTVTEDAKTFETCNPNWHVPNCGKLAIWMGNIIVLGL